jgi:hypothetical protein
VISTFQGRTSRSLSRSTLMYLCISSSAPTCIAVHESAYGSSRQAPLALIFVLAFEALQTSTVHIACDSSDADRTSIERFD